MMSNAEKQYLSAELIALLIQKAKDPIWQMGVLAATRQTWYSIIAVSRQRLIHFYGNQDTGWEHIKKRHGHYSESLYFGKGALGNPSKFTKTSIPIYDFVNVADDVFRNGIVDDKPHADGELFMKHVGTSSRYTGSTGERRDFILILYRGTTIVHSLYPKKFLEKPPRKPLLSDFKIDKSKVKASWHIFKNSLTVLVPYVGSGFVERYVINIQVNLKLQLCTAYLQVNFKSGRPYFTTDKLLDFRDPLTLDDVRTNSIEFIRFLNSIGDADFSHIEEVILMIDTELNS